jgi:hypothetical protein
MKAATNRTAKIEPAAGALRSRVEPGTRGEAALAVVDPMAIVPSMIQTFSIMRRIGV